MNGLVAVANGPPVRSVLVNPCAMDGPPYGWALDRLNRIRAMALLALAAPPRPTV